MSKDFSLLDEPWLPVRLADGRVVELGLREVFRRSREIVALAETAPPSLVAQYRLLLAITHRALTRAQGRWAPADRVRWYREGLPQQALQDYLDHRQDRFWLFHAQAPFLQVAALAEAQATRDKRKPWTQIALASANGNTPVVFDHAVDAEPAALAPAQALGTLLGYLQFTPGGLVKCLRDADKAGPLVNTAAILPLGATLSETLCLALHPAPRPGEEEIDLPAWERPPLTIAQLQGEPVPATGPNDRYTRQSRAVLLLPEADGTVRWLHFAAGWALADDPHAPDPMACFRVGSQGLVRVSFTEGRAFWRDLPAMVPMPALPQGLNSQAAAVLQHALALHGAMAWTVPDQPLLVAGLASDQAKLLRWRAESLRLPTALVAEPERAAELRDQVALAEAVHRAVAQLAVGMLAAMLPDPTSKDTRTRARALLDTGPFTASYFSQAQRALPALMQGLAGDAQDAALAAWQQALRAAALQAWQQVLQGLGRSPRALKADALYWPRLHSTLNQHLPLHSPLVAQEEA
ncbi:type I-E CRISPR-associated protein Cse1/CasA [Ideonella dechloratans]|uniref:type I-E CRISPR-associated protein Cse1/CasA n=1 Tax=Ideonella dechloratans TaxID=36863 RepID=UPI0035AF85BF